MKKMVTLFLAVLATLCLSACSSPRQPVSPASEPASVLESPPKPAVSSSSAVESPPASQTEESSAAPTQAPPTETPAPAGGGEEAAPTGIRPEFKEAMDSYEAFFDEYVAFMQTYEESDNPIELLGQYADFMSRYAETTEAMEAIDEEDLSPEELGYYVEVSARIQQKLLGALE